jgi:hypothetical protein
LLASVYLVTPEICNIHVVDITVVVVIPLRFICTPVPCPNS